MQLIDTHSHLFLDEFSEDIEQVINRAKTVDIYKIIMPNIDMSTIKPMRELAAAYPDYCYSTMGLHPGSVDENYSDYLLQMRELLSLPNNFIAIGEVGIDLYWDTTFKKEQLIAFDMQIQWAIEFNLPIIIHTREAFEEVYSVMSAYKNEPISGVFHSFGGTVEEALRLLQFEEFMLGINGVVTFKKSALPEVLPHIPLSRLVLETDSPYLTPVPNRGKRNESANLKDTLNKVADIYKVSVDEVARITTCNAQKTFKMFE